MFLLMNLKYLQMQRTRLAIVMKKTGNQEETAISKDQNCKDLLGSKR